MDEWKRLQMALLSQQTPGSWSLEPRYWLDAEGDSYIHTEEDVFEFEERPKRSTRVRKPRKSAPPPRRPNSSMNKRIRELEF